MKKIIFCFVCIATILSLVSCKLTPNEQMDKREEYIMKYEKQLKMFDAILSQSVIQDKQYADEPWITDRIQLPDSETIVSLDLLRLMINIYEFNKKEELKLTAEDIVDLYTIPNEEKQAEFDKLVEWFQNEHGTYYWGLYSAFVSQTYELYKIANGKPFIDKEKRLYTAEEKYALAKWGIENIDYDFINSTINDSNAKHTAKCYVKFLHNLGLIDENVHLREMYTIIK